MAVAALRPDAGVCEELAFRGFILSGLERGHRTRSAILLSALLFGFLHVLLSLFQQLFNATLLGIVLGLLAVRSRSIAAGDRLPLPQQRAGACRAGVLDREPSGGSRLVAWLYRNPERGPLSWRLGRARRGRSRRCSVPVSGSATAGPAGDAERSASPSSRPIGEPARSGR